MHTTHDVIFYFSVGYTKFELKHINTKLKIYKYFMVINTISNEKNIFKHLIFCLCPECQSFHENVEKLETQFGNFVTIITTIIQFSSNFFLLLSLTSHSLARFEYIF